MCEFITLCVKPGILSPTLWMLGNWFMRLSARGSVNTFIHQIFVIVASWTYPWPCQRQYLWIKYFCFDLPCLLSSPCSVLFVRLMRSYLRYVTIVGEFHRVRSFCVFLFDNFGELSQLLGFNRQTLWFVWLPTRYCYCLGNYGINRDASQNVERLDQCYSHVKFGTVNRSFDIMCLLSSFMTNQSCHMFMR